MLFRSGRFYHSPLPHLDERNARRSGPFPPPAFYCARITSTMPRSDSLVSSRPFPTHGYRVSLLGEVSSPDTEGLSSFRITLRSMSPLIPRRCGPPYQSRFGRPMLPSHVIESLGHRIACDEATSAFTDCYNLERRAFSFLRMLSEGLSVLLSRHAASRATRLVTVEPRSDFHRLGYASLSGHADLPAVLVDPGDCGCGETHVVRQKQIGRASCRERV